MSEMSEMATPIISRIAKRNFINEIFKQIEEFDKSVSSELDVIIEINGCPLIPEKVSLLGENILVFSGHKVGEETPAKILVSATLLQVYLYSQPRQAEPVQSKRRPIGFSGVS